MSGKQLVESGEWKVESGQLENLARCPSISHCLLATRNFLLTTYQALLLATRYLPLATGYSPLTTEYEDSAPGKERPGRF